MISVGQFITQANDPLQRVDWNHVIQRITNPSPELVSRIAQLRQIRMLDEKQYRKQKTSLPYFCCGVFHPSVRRRDNFAEIDSFVLDFDHFSGDGMEKSQAFDRLKLDPMVKFLFTSPGGDGLKAAFVLDKPCKDFELYTYFYKSFLQQFAQRHGLEQYADYVTHDVTRATFLSADSEAYINPQPEPVILEQYVSLEKIDQGIEKAFETLKKEFGSAAPEGAILPVVNDETLALIKQKLNPNYRPKNKEKNFFVPDEINVLMPYVIESLKDQRISVSEVKPIQYGKQLRVEVDHLWAELNIFYGKRGFSVVKTTKSGSNSDLATLSCQLINQCIDSQM